MKKIVLVALGALVMSGVAFADMSKGEMKTQMKEKMDMIQNDMGMKKEEMKKDEMKGEMKKAM
ncbi:MULTISPECIES: hypothetical protein [unclassified Campylobacter]|uniref:hypothetical protein n=1 Tax=unclassified Campylobacter TaxID=2593542 RepID=UPI003D33A524